MAKTLTTFSVTVSTAGTRVQLKTAVTEARQVFVQGKYTNSGVIFCGNSTVASTNGVALAAREGFAIGEMDQVTADNRIDLSTLFVDGSVNGDIAVIAYIPY